MPSIAIMTAHAGFPWLRQIAGGSDSIGRWRFTIDRIDPDCAGLVVYDDPGSIFACRLPPQRRMLITAEPPGIKTYREGFCDQFGIIRGPVGHPGAGRVYVPTQPALNWFYGVGFRGMIANETFDHLLAMPPPEKIAAISVVLSKKSQLPKHRARLRFVEAAKARLGERLQIFGRGFREIDDKAEAIRPYAYHLVLENNDLAHFWTEKTADCYLGWALPLFSGCANLDAYFPAESFIRLDIARPEKAITVMERVLAEAPYGARLAAIAEARARLLQEYNLFPILARWAEEAGLAGSFVPVEAIIRPNAEFAPFASLRAFAKTTRRRLRSALRAKSR